MSATLRLIGLDNTKTVVPINDGVNHQFHHSDMDEWNQPSGISVEEGEFLYGLIRILKPRICIETGTNIGVSASYICLALQDNGCGRLTTIEHLSNVAQLANDKLSKMGFDNFTIFTGSVATFPNPPQNSVDFMWLDTELDQRYMELVRFFQCLSPGAVACIHDMPRLGCEGFGPIPGELRSLLDSGDLRYMEFPTPHGVTAFQKRR